MIYIDSNIFFYAKIMDRKYGKACARIVEDIAHGKIKASISPLVAIEVANALKKYGMEEEIKDTLNAILSLNMDIHPLDIIILRMAAEIFDESGISPYDCIHAATMKAHGIKELISADKEFDKVANIKRIYPLHYSKIHHKR